MAQPDDKQAHNANRLMGAIIGGVGWAGIATLVWWLFSLAEFFPRETQWWEFALVAGVVAGWLIKRDLLVAVIGDFGSTLQVAGLAVFIYAAFAILLGGLGVVMLPGASWIFEHWT